MYIYIDLVLVLAFAFVSKFNIIADFMANLTVYLYYVVSQWGSLVPIIALFAVVLPGPSLVSMSSCRSSCKPSCWWHSNLELSSTSKGNIGKAKNKKAACILK